MTASPLEPSRAPFPIQMEGGAELSGVLHRPARATPPSGAAIALGHGAGADMNSAPLIPVADGLAARGHLVLRYNFPYMDAGRKLPDPPAVLEKAARAAAAALGREAKGPVFLGGKSMGGRMASMAASRKTAIPGLAGLVFLGYPLHPAGQPEKLRDRHLPAAAVAAPLLFLQGSRDALCDLDLLAPVLERLGGRATLHVVEGADHGFAVRKKDQREPEGVAREIIDTTDAWVRARLLETR